MATKIIRDELDGIVKATRDLANKEVLIGVPSTADSRNGSNVGNASIAYWMEFGVPEQNIPARPFLVPGVAAIRDRAVVRLRKAGESVLDGQPQKADAQFEAIGLEGASSVQNKIRSGPFVPLAPSTIAARRKSDLSQLDELYKHDQIASDQHAALTGVQPLIDTGKLLQSISYVVRKRNGRA